jgi:hypothetical protein
LSCPICEKRKPERFCPSRGEKICAICCGTQREVTIDCPSDCSYLLTARRYEVEHRKALAPEDVPYIDVEVSSELLRRRGAILTGLVITILKIASENGNLRDAEIMEALAALAESTRALESGIYFERPPDALTPRVLYNALVQYLEESKEQRAEQVGYNRPKESEIFGLLVFLLRIGRRETNGRPRSRAFLDFLGAQFPQSAESGSRQEAPRIILP